MAGRDQPENGGATPEPKPGSGYTANPYDSPEHTREFGAEQGPTAQYPTSQFPTGQQPTDKFAAQQPAQQGQWPNPPTTPPPTPPYGVPIPPPGGGEPPQQPPPPRRRGAMWPWVVAALAIFLLVIGGAIVFYLQSVDSGRDASDRPTRSVAPPVTATAAPTAAPTTTFVERFVAISGTVVSNDGSTLVITPSDGGAQVTVITDADTQVLLGGNEGVGAFAPGDGVFVQGGEQQDGRVLARMIIGSLFSE